MWAGKEGAAGFRNGPRGAALFSAPRGLCGDDNGTLIVADSNNSCIRRIDRDGAQLSAYLMFCHIYPTVAAPGLQHRGRASCADCFGARAEPWN